MLLLLVIPFLCLQQSLAQYSEALQKSILFYEAQRSGRLPDDNRIAWRSHSALEDGQDNGVDLTGGWFDAGDHVKFGFPQASSVTVLAWSVVEFGDAYSSAGELDNVLDSIRWPLDYFLKCHVGENEFYGQVGDGHADHAEWTRPENITAFRPSFILNTTLPGSDLAGETAAALTAGSMAFRETDPDYADTLLTNARGLFDFALNYQGFYVDSIPADDFYGSLEYDDELCWAAAWLYRATGEEQYLDVAVEYYNDDVPWAFSWGDKEAGAQLMLWITTGDSQYADAVQRFMTSWRPGGDVYYTPAGLAWGNQWGPLRYTANACAISIIAAHNGIDSEAAIDWARGQIGYMLGDNPMNISYQIIEAELGPSPRKPHHRGASCHPDHSIVCDWDDYYSEEDNDSELIGALVGGPNENDEYVDDREDYVLNEVTTDYNAGFQTTLAGLILYG